MERVTETYEAFLRWLSSKNLATVGHGREIYMHCPDDPAEWIVELQFEVTSLNQ
jgi:effector-binding domain-containing protein